MIITEITYVAAAVALANTEGSIPPKPGNPNPAKLANKFIFDRFPKPPIAPIGRPANGISKGLVLGSNCPNPERPESKLVLRPANPEELKEGNDILDGREVVTLAELTLDVDPVGLDSKGGRPELLVFGLLLPRTADKFGTIKIKVSVYIFGLLITVYRNDVT